MPRKASTPTTTEAAIWQNPQAQIILLEVMEKFPPHGSNAATCALQCHAALKKYLDITVTPTEILRHVREDLYDMKVLDDDESATKNAKRIAFEFSDALVQEAESLIVETKAKSKKKKKK